MKANDYIAEIALMDDKMHDIVYRAFRDNDLTKEEKQRVIGNVEISGSNLYLFALRKLYLNIVQTHGSEDRVTRAPC